MRESTWLFGEQWLSLHSSIACTWQKKAKVGVPELKSDAARIPTLVFLAQKLKLFLKTPYYVPLIYFQLIMH